MKCKKCNRLMDEWHDQWGKNYFCYPCGHGIHIPHKLRCRLWNFFYGMKYFFMDFRKVMASMRSQIKQMKEN